MKEVLKWLKFAKMRYKPIKFGKTILKLMKKGKAPWGLEPSTLLSAGRRFNQLGHEHILKDESKIYNTKPISFFFSISIYLFLLGGLSF